MNYLTHYVCVHAANILSIYPRKTCLGMSFLLWLSGMDIEICQGLSNLDLVHNVLVRSFDLLGSIFIFIILFFTILQSITYRFWMGNLTILTLHQHIQALIHRIPQAPTLQKFLISCHAYYKRLLQHFHKHFDWHFKCF